MEERKKKQKSLRYVVLRPGIAFILIFGVVISLASFFIMRDSILKIHVEAIKGMNEEKTIQFQQNFFNATANIEKFALQQQVVDYFSISPNIRDHESMLATLDAFNAGGAYSAIYLIETDGSVHVSTDRSFVGKNFGFRTYFQDAMNGKTGAEVAIGVVSNEQGYYFSRGVILEDGTIGGVIVSKRIPERMYGLINSVSLNHVLLTDRFGVVVYSTRKEDMYKSLGTLTTEQINQIIDSKKFGNNIITSLGFEDVQPVIDSNTQHTFISTRVDGRRYYVSVTQVGSHAFFCVSLLDAGKIFAQASTIAGIIWLLIFFGTIIVAIFFYIWVGKRLRPLETLAKAITEIRAGRMDRINAPSNELEVIGIVNAINDTLKRLNEARTNIETRVAERTEELERVNRMLIGRELRMIELKRALEEAQTGQTPTVPIIDWKKRYADSLTFEDSVIQELADAYKSIVPKARLSISDEERVLQLLDILIRESKEHRSHFEDLLQGYV